MQEEPPTFGEVARWGTAVVEGLAGAGRWDEAAGAGAPPAGVLRA